MDDNKINPDENQSLDPAQDKPAEYTGTPSSSSEQPQAVNQSGPIYESIPEEELKPEEIPSEVSTPQEEIIPGGPGAEIPSDVAPVVYEENKNRYLIIAGGAIFFLLLFIFFL